MSKKLIPLLMAALFLLHIPSNNLISQEEMLDVKSPNLTVNLGNSEYNPIQIMGDTIELQVNFSANQRQFWFEFSHQGQSRETWINQTLTMTSTSVNVIYRAHTASSQCISGTHYFNWFGDSSANSICDGLFGQDPRILLVLYVEESNFFYSNGTIDYDSQIPASIRISLAEYVYPTSPPPEPQVPNPFADGLGETDSTRFNPAFWWSSDISQQMELEIGKMSNKIGTSTISGYLEDISDVQDSITVLNDLSFARVNLTYPSNQNYYVSSSGCYGGNLPNNMSYIECDQPGNIRLNIDLFGGSANDVQGYLTNSNTGEYYTFEDIRTDWNRWYFSYNPNNGDLELYDYYTGLSLYSYDNGLTTNNGVNGWTFVVIGSASEVQFPLQWEITAVVEQIHPIETTTTYDSPSSLNQIYGILNQGKEFAGKIESRYDVDVYRSIIEHGYETKIEINSESPLLVEILPGGEKRYRSSYCYSLNGVTTGPDSFMTTIGEMLTINCKSEFFENNIPFRIGFNQSTIGVINSPLPDTEEYISTYSFKVSKGKSYTIPDLSDGNVNLGDAPEQVYAFGDVSVDWNFDNSDWIAHNPFNLLEVSRPPIQTIGLGYTNGTFLHASDTVDSYFILADIFNPLKLNFHSTCATSSDEQIIITSNRAITITRMESVSGIPVELLNKCDYSILVQEYTGNDEIYTYPEPSSDTISLTNSYVTIPQFNPQSPTVSEFLSLELFPTLDGKITATQDSGNDVSISIGNQVGINELKFGQSISVGKSVIQALSVTLSGLDGSKVQISLQSYSVSDITTESNLLNGNGYGRLGLSSDEGFDYEDVWQVDVSDSPSYWSVKMVSKSDNFDASINSMMAYSKCVTSSMPQFNEFTVGTYGNLGQTGEYQIVVNKHYSSCPNLNLASRNSVSPGSSVIVDIDGNWAAQGIKYHLYDEDYELVSTSEIIDTINQRVIIDIPNSLSNSYYYLLAENEQGLVFDQHKYTVVDQPYLSISHANGQTTLTDLSDEAVLSVIGRDSSTGIPANWELVNLTWYGYDSQFDEYVIELIEDNIEGQGSEIVSIDYPKTIRQGEEFLLTGKMISEGYYLDFTLNYARPYYTTDMDCQDTFVIDYTLPRNDLLCTVQIKYGQSLTEEAIFDDVKVKGYLQLLSSDMNLLDNVTFTTDNNGFENIRIPMSNYVTNDIYFVKIGLDDEFTMINGENSIEVINLEFEETAEEILQTATDFDFTMIPLRVTALPGDSVDINWQTEGNPISSLYWRLIDERFEIYSADTITFTDDVKQSGSFEVDLPENDNIDMNFILQVTAYSIYGETKFDSITLIGADLSNDVYLEIEPRKPVPGTEFSIDFEIPNAEEWISWSYELMAVYSSNPSVYSLISHDSGFTDENRDSVSIQLPFNQYDSMYIKFDFEIKDGSTFSLTEFIETKSYREMKVESSEIAVLGKDYSVEWSVGGGNLNSADEVESITFSLINFVDDSIEFEEVIIQDGKSGEFTLSIPNYLDTGTHRLVINFDFIDGTSESYIRLINVDPEPRGINFLGINIPSVPYGYDTLIAIFLLANVIFLHVKLRKKEESLDDQFDYGEDNNEYPDDQEESEEQDLYDYIVNELGSGQDITTDNQNSFNTPPIDRVGFVDDQGFEWLDFNGKQWYREHSIGGSWTEWRQ